MNEINRILKKSTAIFSAGEMAGLKWFPQFIKMRQESLLVFSVIILESVEAGFMSGKNVAYL